MVDETVRRKREAIVRRHMEAENAHEYEIAIGTFTHPRYEIIATDRVFDGLEEVREYFRESRTAFPDQRNELIALHHADDAVITEFWLLGTHRGPLLGIEPTGRTLPLPHDRVLRLRGGRLVCERVYFDAARSCASSRPEERDDESSGLLRNRRPRGVPLRGRARPGRAGRAWSSSTCKAVSIEGGDTLQPRRRHDGRRGRTSSATSARGVVREVGAGVTRPRRRADAWSR